VLDADDVPPTTDLEPGPRTTNPPVGLVFGALGLVLAVAFFPQLFNTIRTYDDEGYFLVTVRQFLQHGSLYVHTSGGSYGPFYWSFIGLIYRLTGHSPTLFTGRLLVLAFTALSSAMFAAAVWHVTRNLLFSILCQVTTFCVLILVAGNEPISPGSTIVLLLSILVFALASYSVKQRSSLLLIAGMATGALTMTKINIGIFAAVGLAVALVIGNTTYPRWFRSIIGTGAVLLPFVLMFQRISKPGIATFAFLVAISILGACAVMSVDPISLAPRGLVAAASGFGAVVFVSLLWPLFSGTSPGALFTAVFVLPLQQVSILTILPVVGIQWFAVLITALVVVVVSAGRFGLDQHLPPKSPIWYLALSAAAVFVLGLGIGSVSFSSGVSFGAWLPAIVLLPALALIADVPPRVRLALRFIVPIAILQALHAYPVAGSQIAWATVLMIVPCAIALAAGMDGLRMWREARPALRGFAVGSLCVVVALTAGLWPLAVWVNYYDLQPLQLPGAQLVRVDPELGGELRQLTYEVEKNCYTFYSVPGLDSLYIYASLPTPTGQLANWPGALTNAQEQEVVSELSHLQATGKRVCIVRDLNSPYYAWNPGGSEANRPIGRFIRQYQRVISVFGPATNTLFTDYPRYSVSIKGSLAPLARRHAFDIADHHWTRDVEDLISYIDGNRATDQSR
jgi:hypothetical protein